MSGNEIVSKGHCDSVGQELIDLDLSIEKLRNEIAAGSGSQTAQADLAIHLEDREKLIRKIVEARESEGVKKRGQSH